MNKENWQEAFKGKLFLIERNDKGYERVIRPPGCRLFIKNSEGKILIQKEFRKEQGGFDYRLPGGKVFDQLEPYLECRNNKEKLEAKVLEAAKLEAKQETGADELLNPRIVYKSVCGANVEWDLYFVEAEVNVHGKQALEEDEVEHGIEIGYYAPEEVKKMIKDGLIKEDRGVAFLTRTLSNL